VSEVVYVIGASRFGRVKIGRSATVAIRLAGIQRMSPVPLQIQWQTDGGSELEAALHRRFKDDRIHGEWFDFGERDAVAEVAMAVEAIRAAAVASELEERRRRERPEPRNYAEALRYVDETTAKVKRARAALADAKAEAAILVARALHSCIAEGRNRTEVQKHSPFSPPTVRRIGEKAGVPPDLRYVRTVKDATD
jgi:hypothetical protein